MLQGIDHLVIAVSDLAAAVRDYEALGFSVVEGGRHPVGSYNALVAFADGAYLELLAFYEPSPAHRWWTPLEKGGGLVDFCLRTDDLAGDTAAFRRAGVRIAEPVPQSRKRPDGYELRWVFSLAQGPHRGVAPFLIEDVTPRGERVPSATAHANGVVGVGTVTVAVDDPAAVAAWYAAALGRAGEPVRREDVGGEGVRFTIGPHAVELLRPLSGPAGAPLAAWIAARGASPYAATLGTAGRGLRPLDPARAHGARLTLTP